MTKLTFILPFLFLLCSSFYAKSSNKEIVVSPEIVKVGPGSPTVKQPASNLKNVTDEEFDPTDIAVLKAIYDNASSNAYLKTSWSNVTQRREWAGVVWNSASPKRIIYMDISASHLTTLDVSPLTMLESLDCRDNELTSLSVNGLMKLKYLRCSENKLSFSNLTLKLPVTGGYNAYNPQKTLFTEHSVILGETLDYSYESLIDGRQTVYTWFKNGVKIAGTDQTGKYVPTVEGYYYCKMTNPSFPSLTLTTSTVKVGDAPEYDPDDIKALISIRDKAQAGSPLKVEWADVTKVDTWSGVSWTSYKTRRVKGLYLFQKKIGTLDVTALSKLEQLNCYECNLSYLNISGLTLLKDVNCSMNKIPFSNIPTRLPVWSGDYNYYPQDLLYEKQQLNIGAILDYSSEAFVDNNPTTFEWYRNGIKLNDTDNSGKLTLTEEGFYFCKMYNPYSLIAHQTTNTVTVGNPPEYDPQDIAVLQAIKQNAPANSWLMWDWVESRNIGTWNDMDWSDYPTRRIKRLYVFKAGLTNLDVTQLTALNSLNCQGNNLTSINIKGLTELFYVDCSNNNLTFSTLPLTLLKVYGHITYYPQKVMDKERTIDFGQTLDYSSEAIIDGVASKYIWYKNNEIIENADQSGKYTPTEEGYYHCIITNSKFPLLTLTTAEITVGNPMEYDPNDVDVLKTIRDLAPSDSPLKIKWADDAKVGDWEGVTWSTLKPKRVTLLAVYNQHLTELNVKQLTKLTSLSCSQNLLTSLDVSELPNLQYVDCYENNLSKINMTGSPKIRSLYCGTNKLSFSELPLKLPVSGGDYWYKSMKLLGEETTISAGETIDYSSEAIIDGVNTIFEWYCNDIRIEGTDQTGKYTPTSPGRYHCKMTNSKFPELILTTNQVKTEGLSTYASEDIAALFSIRDNAPSDSPLKDLWADESAFTSWQGVTWSVNMPRKVIALDVSGRKLQTLDLRSLTLLETLNCKQNLLTELKITGLTKLKTVNCEFNQLSAIDLAGSTAVYSLICNHNKLTFSKLPLRSQISGGQYNYYYMLQNPFGEERTMALGELIDYSSEAIIDGVATKFTWYKGDFTIENTDQSGKYTPLTDGYYYCSMTNSKFPDLIITSSKIKIGNPQEYALQDIEALMGIREHSPANSPLRTLWADDTKFASWTGVQWSNTPTRRVIWLQIGNKQLETIDIVNLTELRYLDCSYNNLRSLDISGNSINSLKCNNNRIPFSKLPSNSSKQILDYYFVPQNSVYEEFSINVGETIDFSSETVINGKSTVFTWYRNGLNITNVSQTGKLIATEEGYYYCKMTNPNFYELVLTTNLIKVGNPPEFDAEDVAALKAIRDAAPNDSPLKLEWADDSKIGTWAGVIWNGTRSKKVTELNIAGKNLKILDVSHFGLLNRLYCQDNQLRFINVTGLYHLGRLDCSNNQLSFSKLSSINFTSSYANFTYSPQNPFQESTSIIPGETIDYSSEVLIEGISTVFTWYKDNVKIENANQTGKYTPIFEGYYYCTLTNAKFPGLTLTTNIVRVGNPPEYDPQDVASLKTIRNNAPSGSPLKSLWADDKNIDSWKGIVWSQFPSRKVKELNLSGLGLINIDFPILNSLQKLNCSFNYITNLDLRQIPSLQYINCSNNRITSINIVGLNNLSTLYCNNNQLLFSKLPLRLPMMSATYGYYDQTYPQTLQPDTIGSTLDYSSEATIDGIATKYTWYRNGTLIAGTDNTGKYTISANGFYHCVLTNSKLSGLVITSNVTNVGNLQEYETQDLTALKTIRDNAPADSPLKTDWADETKIGTWNGVTWSTYFPRRVKILSIPNMKLKAIDVKALTDLTELYCSYNQLVTLDVSGIPILQVLDCQNNQLTSIDILTLTKLNKLNCSQNKIPFSQLPLKLLATSASYSYSQQNPFGEVSSKPIGEIIDYSSEASIGGIATSFVWYKNDVKIDGTDNSGIYTPSTEGFYHCTMSNSKFFYLTITTAKTTVGNVIEFDPQDIAALKELRKNVPSDSPLNELWADEKPIRSWYGITWSGSFPKKVKGLNLSYLKLGSLDVTKLTSLETLSCSYSMLKTINIEGLSNLSNITCNGNELEIIKLTGCPKVKTLYCHNNKLSFSKLPLRLPENGGNYIFSPQQQIYEEKTITLGDTINYSQEAIIDGAITAFTWFKNNDPLSGTDQSGKLVPTQDGYYICQMTNSKFPGLTIVTNNVKLGTPSEFDPKNVAVLKALRDLAPENSPLKMLWNESKPLETWTGVGWSLTRPKIVLSLNVNGMQISAMNVKELSKLGTLYCSQNNLTSLDLSGLLNLTTLNCSDNQLTSLNLTQSPKINQLNVANNCLSFSKLPSPSNYYSYAYRPQKVLYEEKSMELGETIDYSSECNIQGVPTTFTWYKNNVKIEGTDQTGKYKPTSYGSYHCSMTNPNFYYLTLTTNKINVGTIPEFDASDVEVLLSIRDNAPADSPLRTEWVDGSMPGSWPGVEWSSNVPKKVIGLHVSDKKLTSLNVTQLTELVNLVCSNNQITELNVTGLSRLNSIDCSFNQITSISLTGSTAVLNLDCSNNRISFTKLPVRLPVSGGKYQYQPMNLIFEAQSLILGEPINYMTEALIDGASTVFTWYKNDQIILSTDQSGKFIPLEVGNYHCSMTNSKFPGLTLTTYDVNIYQLQEYNLQDVETLKAIRNNAPAGSLLKALWADDSKYSQWEGVTWSNYQPKQVRILQLSQKGLESLDVSPFSGLEQLYCNNNQLISLKINGLLNLNYLSCAYNLLSSIDITGVPKIANLFCHNNKISFSKLPLRLSVSGGNYQYWPQQLIFEEQTIKKGEIIDFSSEAIIDGKATVFSWYKDNILIPGIDQSGRLQTTEGGSYYCIMINTKFPALTLTTNKIIVITTPTTFDASDIAALKTIRDNAPLDSPLKTKWTDTTTVETWTGVTWTESSPKRVQELELSSNNLIVLDVTNLPVLEKLDCSDNQLLSLNVNDLTNLQQLDLQNNELLSIDLSGVSNLEVLNCSNNRLPFSQLPSSLPIENDNYSFVNQKAPFKDDTISLGETIDFSTEAIIDGVATVFTWYLDSSKIEQTDQSGKYTPTAGGKYYCTMTNSKFPGLMISSGTIEVKSLHVNVDDVTRIVSPSIYPNPTNGKVFIEFPLLPQRGTLLSVFDITGKLILKQNVLSHKEQIDLNGFPVGIYFLIINNSNFSKTYKIKLN